MVAYREPDPFPVPADRRRPARSGFGSATAILPDHVAPPLHAGAEGPVELLDGGRLGILCLLRPGLPVLACLTTTGQGADHGANTRAIAGITGDGTDDRAARRAPGRPPEPLTPADGRA